ncbi:nucleolar MIF4G domain-containing protein 1 homolog [Toxorhynchites rutilus septentrionalis]|uniref:nucleolar MIF4G domain-containing protein 1 homolog n=1 Tax=Toxorhynchites rutilus septentrionalis TaxID=329112 RepID=UPI002478376D|nr:nucleolar MIF4G domain-containing protein 1 homolog [Toxorhynchites rutilus septentrionalis]
MKIRPQKHARLGFSGKSKKERRSNQPKTRKEIRKEKRQQKKINRFAYHSRKKSDRYQHGSEQNNEDEIQKKQKRAPKRDSDEEDDEEMDEFEDEEIESDAADDEPYEEEPKEQPTVGGMKSQLEQEREEELRELQKYERGLKDKRISQLQAANEEDELIIRKYEKLLKINRRKDKSGVPKSFNDGLDYALELCTEDNVRKMYEAAKEAAEIEQNSEDEFADDVEEALGTKKGRKEAGKQRKKKAKRSQQEVDKKKMEQLKEIEKKYLGDDEVDSLDGFDSELEIELDDNAQEDYSENDELYESEEDELVSENEIKLKKSNKSKKVDKKKNSKSKTSDKKNKRKEITEPESDPEEDSEFEEDVFGGSDSDEFAAEENKKAHKKSSKKVTFADKKGNGTSKSSKIKEKKQRKDFDSDPEEDSEFDEDVFGGDDSDEFVTEDNEETLENSSRKVKFVKNESKSESEFSRNKKKKRKEDPESDPEEDSEFDEDVFGGDESDSDGSGSDAEGVEDKAEESKQPNDVWEDIYGRKRDKQGNVIIEKSTSGKYVPPHLRARMEAGQSNDPKKQEKLLRLKRQLKGQINRLAESNVHRISIEMDNLYMQNARFDMNSTVTSLVLEALVSPSLAPDRMVLEHMLLITILHANVGSEVGSHFLETVVQRFDSLLERIDSFDVEDKTLDNCVLILCHMYTFQIFKNKLVYDVIDQLLAKFNEKSVECILLVLRSIGFVLRKDDPLALKEMIQKVQKRAAEAPAELKSDTRVKFMLDTLLAVKNNNMNKIPQYDSTLVEHFRKILKGMITSGKYVSSLNIGLDDLLNVDERGKWWLVGSAWHGNKDGKEGGRNSASSEQPGGFSQQLLDLARKQRMNTDDKRNVFCAIMSAEDYLDAFDKILRLAIKDQRVVVSVIIHCCLSEKDYNPYYSVLSQKFCEYDRRYQLAAQFAIWDRLKEIHSLKQVPAKNLAKLLTHLIGEGGLALSVLKVIEFAEIDKVTLRFVRQIMLGLLLLEEENKCLQVFNRIAPSLKLKEFKDSLRLFLHHFLLKGSDKSNVPEEQLQLLQQRIKMAEHMLHTSDSRVLF